MLSCLACCCTTGPSSGRPACSGSLLWCFLLLLTFITGPHREEVKASGLAVLVDARGTTPLPILFSALRSLQVSQNHNQMCTEDA